jgi:hypothetical protein
MRSGFLPDRIVHVHPSRLCALACRHCYSESAPVRTTALAPAVLMRALDVLRAEGYAQVSLSGGEPLLYGPVREVIAHARDLGFRVTLITSGYVSPARVDEVVPLLDGVAVSFDGLAATHDEIRGKPDAFARASDTLRRIAALGRPVAAAVSLTRAAIPELPDLVDHVVALGARAVQLRPVAAAGRARTLGDDAFHTSTDRARLYMVALALAEEVPDGVRVHTDLAPAQGLWAQRGAYGGLLAGDCTAGGRPAIPLADLVNPIVITDARRLKPIAYDFAPRFDVAAIDGLTGDTVGRYKQDGLPAFETLVGRALGSLRERNEVVDWFDHCTRLSEAC